MSSGKVDSNPYVSNEELIEGLINNIVGGDKQANLVFKIDTNDPGKSIAASIKKTILERMIRPASPGTDPKDMSLEQLAMSLSVLEKILAESELRKEFERDHTAIDFLKRDIRKIRAEIMRRLGVVNWIDTSIG